MNYSLTRLAIASAVLPCAAHAADLGEPVGQSPRFAFVALNVVDAAASIAFYNALLGFTEQVRHDGGDSIEVGVGSAERPGGPQILFVQTKIPHAPYTAGSRLSRIAFIVADVDAVCRKHRERTGSAACKPIDAKAVRVKVAFVKDPDGNEVELLQPYR